MLEVERFYKHVDAGHIDVGNDVREVDKTTPLEITFYYKDKIKSQSINDYVGEFDEQVTAALVKYFSGTYEFNINFDEDYLTLGIIAETLCNAVVSCYKVCVKFCALNVIYEEEEY